MRRTPLGFAVFAAVLLAPTIAEARRLRIPIIRSGGSGEHDDVSWVFWLIAIVGVCIAIKWALGRRKKDGTAGNDVEASASANANMAAPRSLTKVAGRLAREVSEARSSADSAWANKATAHIESRSEQIAMNTSSTAAHGREATARPRSATTFKAVRTAANAAPRTTFGRR